jgi:hypothetical protein
MTADERHEQVEARLADLARRLARPGEHDLSVAVLDRIRAGDAMPMRMPATGGLRRAAMAAAAVCLALAASYGLFSPVRDAAASMLRLVGIDIRHADEGATPPAVSPPVRADLGEEVHVDDVSAAAGFDVPMPSVPVLGAADEAYVVDGGTYTVVTLIWRERPGIPVAPESGASALLSVFRGAPPNEDYVEKILYEGGHARRVSVNGALGVYVGGPQAVRYLGANGDLLETQPRLSANSLIWQQDGVTLRLESALGQQASIAIAESTG